MEVFVIRAASVYCALLLLAILAIFCAIPSLYLLGLVGFYEQSELAGVASAKEIFARMFLVWLLAFCYGPLILSHALRSRIVTERWVVIALILFALGAGIALSDPFHQIREEGNWIRYFTAGLLTTAGVVSVVASLGADRRWLDRLFGVLFGCLLVFAACDELFEFHERAGDVIDGLLPSFVGMAGQDMVTLAVAMLGAVALVMASLAWRFLPWLRALTREPRYRRSFSFFALAVLSFLTAMLLDTGDWHLGKLAEGLQAALVGDAGWLGTDTWPADAYIGQAANALEELLEGLAAIFFLLVVGSLFSLKALGFGEEQRLGRVALGSTG